MVRVVIASETLPASASPSRWGFGKAGNSAPPRDAWTLPEAMRERGFRTAGFTSNSLLRKPGFRAGFDRFLGFGGMDVWDDLIDATAFSMIECPVQLGRASHAS